MEPDYKKMFEELAAQIEEEYRWACESHSEYKAKYFARGEELDHRMITYYNGAEFEAWSLKLTVDRIKQENGLT